MAFCRLRCLHPADWFERNLQGDVVAVYDYQGTKLVSYKYDAWGNFTTTNHQSTIPAPVSNNPFRYRGYYYDKDLNLYYLNARYYDQGTRRFVSGDEADYLGANGDLISYNLYAYCSNNPVMLLDPSGNVVITTSILIAIGAGAIIGAIIGASSFCACNRALDFRSKIPCFEYN